MDESALRNEYAVDDDIFSRFPVTDNTYGQVSFRLDAALVSGTWCVISKHFICKVLQIPQTLNTMDIQRVRGREGTNDFFSKPILNLGIGRQDMKRQGQSSRRCFVACLISSSGTECFSRRTGSHEIEQLPEC